MGARGRRSFADMTDSADAISVVPELPPPPKHLTVVQRALWKEIVASKTPDWFSRDVRPLLEVYCQEVDRYREMCRRRNKMKKGSHEIERVEALIQKQAHLVLMAATKLRLTPQSRYAPRTASRRDRDANAGLVNGEAESTPWND